MRIIHYFLLIICLSFVSVDSFSKQVNLSQAESIAKQFHSFLYPQTRATDATCELVYTGKLSATSPSFYVFNYEAGFVMVAGDDLSTPVLAYSPSNQFVATNLPCNITYWLDGYEQQIASLRDETGDAHPGWDNLSILFSTTRDASSDKLYSTALWYQYTPYNKYCPTVDGSGTATGCVEIGRAHV